MQLALFDLDNTLLDGDSDYLWGEYLADLGVVDAVEHRRKNEAYYAQYQANTLDVDEFLAYQLAPLAQHPREQLEHWRAAFIADRIEPNISDRARQLVDGHRSAGCGLCIVTATNRFITEPIADLFQVDALIAIELEEVGGDYTGRATGIPSSGQGKVHRVKEHYGQDVFTANETWFYSDSVRDLPLLESVDHPVVVNGDSKLIAHAAQAGWPTMTIRR